MTTVNFSQRGRLVTLPDKHIYTAVKPPKLTNFSLKLILEAGLLNEGGSVEYLSKDCIYKSTLREGCLCTEDGKYFFVIREARRLKQDEIPIPLLSLSS